MKGLSYQARFGAGFYRLLLLWMLLAVPLFARAQLVADGQTNVLDGVATNLFTQIIVGTNGTFTLLVVTNGATVTNSGTGAVIGNNASAQSNRVVVTGGGSVWNNSSGAFTIGLNGSASELDILNGGLVTGLGGVVGQGSSSSNNLVLVSGAGSTWTTAPVPLHVGYTGSYNTLIVTNGGTVTSGSSGLGESSPSAMNNAVVITGPGSSWNSGYFYLGYLSGGGNRFDINNGGTFTTSGTFDIGVYSGSNRLAVADAGSALLCQSFRIGYSSTANQCVVSNGARLTASLPSQPTMVVGTFTVATVTGAGTVWTNAGDLDFGEYSNVLSVLNGGTLVDNNGYVENGSGKPNTAIVAGANSLWKNLGDLHVADVGAQLFITNGGAVIDSHGSLGDNIGNNYCYALVSGPGSTWINRTALYVGIAGYSNQLVVADSGQVMTENFYLGSSSLTNNLVTLNGGSLIVTNVGSGTINLIHGTLTLNSGLVQCDTLFDSTATAARLVLNGGTLQMHSSAVGTTIPLIVGDGTDPATLMLTTIGPSGGSHNLLNGLIVSSNASLTGAGTVVGNVYIGSGGIFVPGTTNVWSLTLSKGLVLSNGCTTVMGLYPLGGSAHNVTGLTNVIYGGTLQLTNLGGSYSPGQTFTLFTSTHYSGAFNNLVPAAPGSGLRWDTNELNIDGKLRIFPTTTPPPFFSSVVQANGDLVATAGNGIAYDPCYLLTSTNLATPLFRWTGVATNYFDVTGTTTFTNTIAPGEPARFYQLLVN